MIFSKLFSHKSFGIAAVLVTNMFFTNIYNSSSFAAINIETNNTEFLKESDETTSWLQKIFGRRKGRGGPTRGGSGKDSVCFLPLKETRSRFIWNQTPRFVWFSDMPDLQVKIRAVSIDKVVWEEGVPNPERDHRKPHITSYRGVELIPEERYVFEVYTKSNDLEDHFTFRIIPESDRLEIDAKLNSFSLTENQDARIRQRIEYFGSLTYHKDSGLTESKDKKLSFDMINEVLDLSSSEDKIETIRAESCEEDN